jgi:dTDP-4-dehydrorhamnose reductase
MKSKIILLGADGLLGSSLKLFLLNKNYEIITVGRSISSDHILDLLNTNALTNLINQTLPTCIINLVALTNVDNCEVDVSTAMRSNGLVPGSISDAINKSQNPEIHFIHISTDQVYIGDGGHQEDRVCPVNVYGLSKLTGELMIKNSKSTILRTNFFGKSICKSRTSFSDWAYKSIYQLEPITLFKNILFNPLHISTICKYIDLIMERKVFGVFNLGSKNGISKAEFVLAFISGLGYKLNNVSIVDYSVNCSIAKRPLNMTTNVSKFESALQIELPNIYSEIDLAILEYA